jgi:hypothetical protein
VVCFIVILYFSKMAFPSSPEKKYAASKSPSPTFRAKKRKAGAESKEPDPQADPQAAGNWTLSYKTARGAYFGIFESY